MSERFQVSQIAKKEIAGIYLYQWIGWLITVALIAAAAFLKVGLPELPPPPALPEAASLEAAAGSYDLQEIGAPYDEGILSVVVLRGTGDTAYIDRSQTKLIAVAGIDADEVLVIHRNAAGDIDFVRPGE